jgi:hypothetical protein
VVESAQELSDRRPENEDVEAHGDGALVRLERAVDERRRERLLARRWMLDDREPVRGVAGSGGGVARPVSIGRRLRWAGLRFIDVGEAGGVAEGVRRVVMSRRVVRGERGGSVAAIVMQCLV